MATQYKTPGVYLSEPNSFPPAIVGVETAVPCFIGYTEKATDSDDRDLHLVPKRIGSMAEFMHFYGAGYPTPYYLVAPRADGTFTVPAPDRDWGEVTLHGTKVYHLAETGGARFNLYNSMRLFYANGGGACFVISCGTYGGMAEPPPIVHEQIEAALDACKSFIGPTMVAIPDAVLLSGDGFAIVAEKMVNVCAEAEDRMALLDIPGVDALSPGDDWRPYIEKFRDVITSRIRPEQWRFGAAYFPPLVTSIVAPDEIDISCFATDRGDDILQIHVRQAGSDGPKLTAKQMTQKLVATVPGFDELLAAVAASQSVLPPSGALAGVWTANDQLRGVWNAPANTSIATLIRPLLPISGEQQEDLNVPANGVAVNAIRTFQGRGALIWGARTLDSNSNDWRYIQVRRTIIHVEQSVKQALESMVFAPNTEQTWVTVVSMIESFLHGLWSAGGVMGGSPAEAYSVQAGLGSTMTSQDVLEGIMRVQITLQIHPAEFIELTFRQQMLGGA